MANEQRQSAVEQLQALLRDHRYTPEQIADTAVHALYPKLSAGAANTYARLGRGMILMDLRDLESGRLDTSYVPQGMLRRLSAESELFEEAERAVGAYDPLSEFVIVVWQAPLLLVYKLAQI